MPVDSRLDMQGMFLGDWAALDECRNLAQNPKDLKGVSCSGADQDLLESGA